MISLSTYALTLYKYTTTIDSKAVLVADMKVTQRKCNFAKKQGLPLYFVSAADGTNVVKMFKETIKMAMSYKQNSSDFMDEVMLEALLFKVAPHPSKCSGNEPNKARGKGAEYLPCP
ncbi:rab-like protein 2A isoform X1 [Salvelinus alpinus]|uniref:rab-like protein 2A isoform X1 n=1 Tax=Salvelinus alpinus TaxID=8036 RepID=UPI0039FBB112